MKVWSELQGLYASGCITRRDFLRQASALGLLTTVPATLLGKDAQSATPKRGGKFRLGVRGGSTSDTLAPTQIFDTHAFLVSWQLRNNLTEISPDGGVVGELAASWDVSPDAAKWTFKLQKDIEFHNGKTLDAEDVVYSMNLHRGEESKSRGKNLLDRVDDVRVDGKDTVIFDLKEGNADFPTVLAEPYLAIAIRGTEGAEWEKGIGTGPFTLVEWNPGVRALVQQNSNYFKAGKPYFSEIETLNILDISARLSALRTGEVDAIDDPDVKILDQLSRTPGIQIIEVSASKHYSFPMRTDRAPFDNNDVRMAIKYAADREAILRSILRGHGYIGNDQPIGRNQTYFSKNLPQRERDLDRAKFHLRKAGYSTLAVKLHSSEGLYPGAVDAAVLLKEHLAPVGIDLEVVRAPSDGYWSDVWRNQDWTACYWSARPTEDLIFSTVYASNSDSNDAFWKNAHFDELLKRARGELNADTRRQLYAEMQELVNLEGGQLIPVFANYIMAASDQIRTGEKVASNWILDGNRCSERWWFA